MSSIKGWVALGDIVDEVSANLSEYHGHYFGTLYNYAVDCLKLMNYDSFNTPKEICLPVDQSLKRAVLPDDFVNYLGVGYEHNGNIIMLGYNGKMTRPCPDSCGVESLGDGGIPQGLKHMPWNGDSDWEMPLEHGTYWGAWGAVGGATLTNYYGHGGGWNEAGFYRVRKDMGYIDFNADFRLEEIILVYITNGFNVGRESMLPEMAYRASKEYMKWQFFLEKMNISGGAEMRDWRVKASEAERRWIIECRNAEKRQRAQPMYEILAAYRRSYGPHIKM